MNTLTKMAQGLIGPDKPQPALAAAVNTTHLPPANTSVGMPLMQALAQRQSLREFDPTPLPDQTLSDLLWAAAGINRPVLGGRTIPRAMNSQEVDVYAVKRASYAFAAAGAMAQTVGWPRAAAVP